MSEGKSTDISHITLDCLKAWLLRSQLGNVWGQRTSDNMWTHFWLLPLGEGYPWSLGYRPGMLCNIQQCSGQPDNTEWSDTKCQKCWSWETMTEESKKKKKKSKYVQLPYSTIIHHLKGGYSSMEPKEAMNGMRRETEKETDSEGKKGLSWRSSGKESTFQWRGVGSIPGWGTKIPNNPWQLNLCTTTQEACRPWGGAYSEDAAQQGKERKKGGGWRQGNQLQSKVKSRVR